MDPAATCTDGLFSMENDSLKLLDELDESIASGTAGEFAGVNAQVGAPSHSPDPYRTAPLTPALALPARRWRSCCAARRSQKRKWSICAAARRRSCSAKGT